jgi:hypothetical protein
MLMLAVVIKQSTLRALEEHSVKTVGGAININDNEAIVLLQADTVRRLLDLARPGDTRIDDAIMRLAL